MTAVIITPLLGVNSTDSLFTPSARTYAYDPIGNRLAATEGTAPSATTKDYTTNQLNQYTQIPNTTSQPLTTAALTYDDDGNMLSDGTGKTYAWDAENRLIQVTLSNGEIVKYYYDSDSHRIKRDHIASSVTEATTYLYDSWNVIAETKTEATPATKTYTWGLDLSNTLQGAGGVGGLLSTKTIDTGVSQFFYHTYDANGNTSELFASDTTIVAHYEYDIFGKMTHSIGPHVITNAYRFSTKVLDVAVSLYYYGYRFYDAGVGRWLNRDPIAEKGGENIFLFCGNRPIENYDFLGNCWEKTLCSMTCSVIFSLGGGWLLRIVQCPTA